MWWLAQGIDGLILVAPAMVAPMFHTSRAPSNSGRCQQEGNALKASFEGPERPQEDKKRRSVHALLNRLHPSALQSLGACPKYAHLLTMVYKLCCWTAICASASPKS